MSDNIKEFKKNKVMDYPVQDEAYQRIRKLIFEYAGEVSLAEMLGVLRIIEHDLISDHT